MRGVLLQEISIPCRVFFFFLVNSCRHRDRSTRETEDPEFCWFLVPVLERAVEKHPKFKMHNFGLLNCFKPKGHIRVG